MRVAQRRWIEPCEMLEGAVVSEMLEGAVVSEGGDVGMMLVDRSSGEGLEPSRPTGLSFRTTVSSISGPYSFSTRVSTKSTPAKVEGERER